MLHMKFHVLPRDPSPQLFRFLHGHPQPFLQLFSLQPLRQLFCMYFICSLLSSSQLFTAAVSLSSWSLAAVLQLFSLQPFPQLLSTLRYFICSFLPRDPSPQLFCFLPGHRKPFCSFFLLWQLFSMLYMILHDISLLPRDPSPQLFRFLHGHRQPFCSFFLCSIFGSCFACCDISFATFFLSRPYGFALTPPVLRPFFSLSRFLPSGSHV